MWIHESFTNYSETLFTEYYYGKAAGSAYIIGSRQNIVNDVPIIAPYGVNKEGSGDMYCKGGNMIHMIRQVIGNDKKFRNIMRGLNKTFYHQTVTTEQVQNYISKKAKKDFSSLFDQYLRTTMIPVLEYKIEKNIISYRWDSIVAGFSLPIKVSFGRPGRSAQWITPAADWQSITMPDWYDKKTFVPDENFYIRLKKVK